MEGALDKVFAQGPANIQWWAVRLGSLVAPACILVVLAVLVAGSIQSRTLATRTVLSPSREKIDFRIHREHEDVMVSVKQVRSGSGTGWSKTMGLGTTKSLGGTKASIELDEGGERVLLRVGERLIIFDLNSKHFDIPLDDSQ